MPTLELTTTGSIAGLLVTSRENREADGQIGHELTLPTAVAGTVSSYDVGPPDQWTLTLPDHGLSVADPVDVYWDSGRRYGMQVASVAGDDVTVEDGANAGGDSVPTSVGAAVTVSKQKTIDTDFDGDLVVAIGAACGARSHLSLIDDAGALALSIDLIASELWRWLNGGAAANPLAGKTIDHAVATQAETTTEATLKLGVLYDSTG